MLPVKVNFVRQLGLARGRGTPRRRYSMHFIARHSSEHEINAMIAVLLGCEFRRAELAVATVGELQRREEQRVFADLIGKGGHVRTVPLPDWVGSAIQRG
jgi:hypothetical protein